jgi:hypothetical protein
MMSKTSFEPPGPRRGEEREHVDIEKQKNNQQQLIAWLKQSHTISKYISQLSSEKSTAQVP